MTKTESPPLQSSTSSGATASSEHSDAILALGRKLVDELELESSADTLGRWMAHYLSELIIRGESEGENGNEVARKECFDVILALWGHRSEFPNGRRPLESLEPIVRAIASLDPEDETPRYFRQARPKVRLSEEETEALRWLDCADGLDYSAKLLIGCCLAEAANSAVDKAKEWVKHAKAAGFDDPPSEIVISFVAPNDDPNKASDQNARLREKLEGRLERLTAFVNIADALANDLQAQLDVLRQDSEDGSTPK